LHLGSRFVVEFNLALENTNNRTSGRLQCRSCSGEIDFEVPTSEAYQFSVVCSKCSYVNVVERYEFRIDLQKMCAAYELHIPLEDSIDSKLCALTLKKIASALAARIADQVRVALPIARSALPIALGFRESMLDDKVVARISGSESGLVPPNTQFDTKAFEVLYGMLGIHGGLDVQAVRTAYAREARDFLKLVGPMIGDFVGCALQATQMRRGLLAAQLISGVLVSAKTLRHTWTVEWYQNRKELFKRAAPPLLDAYQMVSPESTRAQRKLLGFDTNDVLELAEKDFARLRRSATVHEDEYLRFIDLNRVPSRDRRIVSYLTLTPDRLRRFRVPYFFDLGAERDQPLDDLDVVIESVAFNWLYYYPFTAMTLESGTPGLVATGRPAFVGFLTNLLESKAGLLARIVDAARDRGNLGPDLAALADRAHRRLEKDIRDEALRNGWFATHVDRYRSERLPCGDMDALVAKLIPPDTCILLLCEAKDIDMAFFRDGGWEECERKVKGAIRQLEQKAKWLAKNWSSQFAQEVFGSHFAQPANAIVVRTLVTRDCIPVDFLNGVTGIPFFALSMALKEIGTLDASSAQAKFHSSSLCV